MKLFLKKIFAYILIVMTLLVITFTYSFYKYLSTRVPVIKYNKFHKNIKNIDSAQIILGSSHTFFGIDSKLLKGEYFNFSSISQSLMEDYAILKHVKKPIKTVILPISYFTNWFYLYKTTIDGEKLRIIDYLANYDISYPSHLNRKDMKSLINELSKINFKVLENNFDGNGNIIGRDESHTNKIRDAKIAFERHNIGKDFRTINPYLDSINIFCKKNKIELYLIIMPFTHDYLKYTNNGEFDEYLMRVKTNYISENCFILDFRTHFNQLEERRMFRDSDHLSFFGRSTFTKFLNKQIQLTKLVPTIKLNKK